MGAAASSSRKLHRRRLPRNARYLRAFTLIEVLLATALLAAALALGFATLKAATATVNRGLPAHPHCVGARDWFCARLGEWWPDPVRR
jgi:prepilin-type N-terminal cleavage/methylation domain-containing protein